MSWYKQYSAVHDDRASYQVDAKLVVEDQGQNTSPVGIHDAEMLDLWPWKHVSGTRIEKKPSLNSI